jgi:predicted nucleic acid-binding protein
VLCALSVAEIGHGIYRADSDVLRNQRRAFLDELKATVPVHAITATTAELIAQIGGESAAKGVNLPLADLIIGASAIELGFAVASSNLRDFRRIPGLHLVQV